MVTLQGIPSNTNQLLSLKSKQHTYCIGRPAGDIFVNCSKILHVQLFNGVDCKLQSEKLYNYLKELSLQCHAENTIQK